MTRARSKKFQRLGHCHPGALLLGLFCLLADLRHSPAQDYSPSTSLRSPVNARLESFGDSLNEILGGFGEVGAATSEAAAWPRTRQMNEYLRDTQGLGEWGTSLEGFATIAKASEVARKAVQNGDTQALYLFTKETLISTASDAVGALAGSTARTIAIGASGNPIVAGLASYAASALVSKAVEGVLTSLWDRIEQLLEELTSGGVTDADLAELDNILAAAKANLDLSLQARLNKIRSQVNQLGGASGDAERLRRALENLPSYTASAFAQSSVEFAQQFAYILNANGKSEAVPYSPATSTTPDKLYDVQLLGAVIGADSANKGNGHKIIRGLPKNEARNFILNSLQYTSDDYIKFIGVLKEYPYDPNAKFEDKDYPGIPTRLPIRQMP